MTSLPQDLPVLVHRSALTLDDTAEVRQWLDQPSVREGLGIPPGLPLKAPEREWVFLNSAGTRVAYISASSCDVAAHEHGHRPDGQPRSAWLLSTAVPKQHQRNRYGPAAKVSLFESAEYQAIDIFCFHIRDDHQASRIAAERAGLVPVGPAGQRDEHMLYYRYRRPLE